MAEVDPALAEQWKQQPSKKFDLIIRVEGDPAERVETLEQRGVELKRTLRLTHALAIRCTGKTAQALARLSWVTRIEADRTVRALGSK